MSFFYASSLTFLPLTLKRLKQCYLWNAQYLAQSMLYTEPTYCSYKPINNKIAVNYIFWMLKNLQFPTFIWFFEMLILFLGNFCTEYQRKDYGHALRCKRPHFIIFIHKRVAWIRIELLGPPKNALFLTSWAKKHDLATNPALLSYFF